MKKYSLNLLFGIFLGAGFFLCLFIWKQINLDSENYLSKRPLKETGTSIASISHERLVKTGDKLSIEVIIKNKTDKELDTVRGHVDFYDAGGMFGNCWENFKNFLPNERRKLAIKCWKFKAHQVPADTILRSKIRYVWIENAS